MSVIQSLIKQVLLSFRLSVFLKISAVHARSYSVDGVVLNALDMSESSEVLKEVRLLALSAGQDGRGVYSLPDVGSIAIVNFVEGDARFPFVQGYYEESYKTSASLSASLSLLDGGTGLVSIENKDARAGDLFARLLAFMQSMKTVGPPSNHTLSPDDMVLLQELDLEFKKLFKG